MLLLRLAKYAVYLAICCVVYKACEKCICKLFATKDPWSITEEALGSELAAGHVYKQDGMLGFWTERYMVINNNKISLYADQTRTALKAEYVLAGASAERCTSHADEEHKFYFNLSHPDQGVREFYVISEPRRSQWMDLLSSQGASLRAEARYGTLLKAGGITTQYSWDERWCVCAGPTLDYYASKTDDLPMGSLWLVGASIRDSTARGKKYCVEILQDPSAKESRKGKKRYVFALETEGQRDEWLSALEGRTVARETGVGGAGADAGAVTTNPMLGPEEGMPTRPTSEAKRGYLEKKGKRLGGYSKRFFCLEPKAGPGLKETDIKMLYYETEDNCKKNAEMKGFVPVLDISKLPRREGSLEMTFTCKGKDYTLRAASPQERDEWVAHVTAWHTYAKELKTARAERAATAAAAAGGGGAAAAGAAAAGGGGGGASPTAK